MNTYQFSCKKIKIFMITKSNYTKNVVGNFINDPT